MSASFPPEPPHQPPHRDPRPFRPGFTPFEEEPLARSRADEALTPIRVTTYEVHPLRQPRMVMVYGELDGERATEVCSELMTLDALGDGPITMHLRDAERRRVFTATQALAYGFVHDVAGIAPPGLS